MNRPEMSAIIISFNGREFLPDCLRTLTGDLRGIEHEIIVVDNGSRDGSVAFIGEQYSTVRCIQNPGNVGFAKAVNIGIAASTGRYVYLLNQDLRFRPGAIATLLARLKKEPTLGMIGPKFVSFEGRTQQSARALPRYRHILYDALLLSKLFPRNREFSSWRMGWFDHESEAMVEQPLGSAMLVSRDVLNRIGVFDEQFPIFFNDVDFCRRLKDAGLGALYCPSAVVEHYLGGSTRHRPFAMKVESHRSMYRYLKKYARPYEYPILWLCGFLLLVGLIPSALVATVKTKTT